ncbi:hypothetical protein EX30DRAFT_354385 [Ascodesmis nigricans]|uniref:LCCL domain-containing protein n=1 Tax=Ascodesmis nigricans TaxID=341454 RepID=A0A4S2N2D0_9PEZI|nr:hypothetical protein EX30DRAFT_354385 [Ascodesmis nigricans]
MNAVPDPTPSTPLQRLTSADLNPAPAASPPRHRRLLTACRTWLDDALVPWVQGPSPPLDVAFTPLFPTLQQWPSRVLDRMLKRRKVKALALGSFLLLWLVLFSIVVHYSRFADRVEGIIPNHLSCDEAFWYKNNECGLDGSYCKPFENRAVAFRCPANCLSAGQIRNPRAVGDLVLSHLPFVVGGPDPYDPTNITYRADSFICPSAIHAGIVSNRYGGCGIVLQTGMGTNYPSSRRHGVSSIGFPSSFPSSYTFVPQTEYHSTACQDLRWHLFAVSIPFTTLVIILLPRLPAVAFSSLFSGIFFHVALASDPPFMEDPSGLVSRALSRFLPAAFIAAVLWTHVFKPVHHHPIFTSGTAIIEKCILFLGGLWIGALNNLTFDVLIPLDRLTPRDLNSQPGAKAALAIVIILLFFCALLQIHYLRLSGQLPSMLALYALFGIALGLLAAIPGNSLRIHHYILALLLLPGTRVPTRASMLFQGILLGLFINGVARWGFAGIVETPYSLQGDGLFYSAIPAFQPPPLVADKNVTVYWNTTALDRTYVEGVSLLVNDVERARAALEDGEVTVERKEGEVTFLRLGYVKDLLVGSVYDYTRAGVVDVDGSWKEPGKGWSR